MGTFFEHSDSHIAIMAKSTKSLWVAISLQPGIKLCAAVRVDLFPMLDAPSVKVVNAKKFRMFFPATRAGFSVTLKDLFFNGLLATAIVHIESRSIFLVILPFHAKYILPVFLAPFAVSCKTLLCVFQIMPTTGGSLGFCVHDALYHENTWNGETIFP